MTDEGRGRRLYLRALFLIGGTIVLAGLAACNEEPPTAVPVSNELPTVSAPLANVTPTDDVTAETVEALATFTPIPTSTVAATATVMAQEERIRLSSPADFGGDRNPFTGELAADPGHLERRPIAAKISNAPPRWVRPQSGLSQADLVFEHLTEGSITRFTAIIYGHTPPKIGPIRSARLIDVELPAMYDAALAFSGSSIGVSRRLFGSDIRPRILRTLETGYYRSGEDKPYEHTLYAEPVGLWQALEARGENHTPAVTTTMAFDSLPPTCCAGPSAHLTYERFGTVEWRYNAEKGRYFRWVDDEPHIDANNDEQISVANVIIVFAEHELDTSICEHQQGNQCLAYSTTINLNGEGEALVMRDGMVVQGLWRRMNRSTPLQFFDREGQPVPLQIGPSWFQVVPSDFGENLVVAP